MKNNDINKNFRNFIIEKNYFLEKDNYRLNSYTIKAKDDLLEKGKYSVGLENDINNIHCFIDFDLLSKRDAKRPVEIDINFIKMMEFANYLFEKNVDVKTLKKINFNTSIRDGYGWDMFSFLPKNMFEHAETKKFIKSFVDAKDIFKIIFRLRELGDEELVKDLLPILALNHKDKINIKEFETIKSFIEQKCGIGFFKKLNFNREDEEIDFMSIDEKKLIKFNFSKAVCIKNFKINNAMRYQDCFFSLAIKESFKFLKTKKLFEIKKFKEISTTNSFQVSVEIDKNVDIPKKEIEKFIESSLAMFCYEANKVNMKDEMREIYEVVRGKEKQLNDTLNFSRLSDLKENNNTKKFKI